MWLEPFLWVGQKAVEVSSETVTKHFELPGGSEGTPILSPPNGTERATSPNPADHGIWALRTEGANGQKCAHGSIDNCHEEDVETADRPYTVWPVEKEKILLGPYEYSLQQPGKDIRGRFIAALNAWLNIPEDKLTTISKVVTMLHTASLLVDDIEDSSELRRGAPAAHSIFGDAQTINSANYVYVLALQEVSSLTNPAATKIYTEELLNLHRGQGMELFWRDTLQCPSEKEYIKMVENKTGGLFRMAARLMQNESHSDKNCVPLVNLIGTIFQICDDYLNLRDPRYSKNKGMYEDITEGKFSFPIIHGVRSNRDSQLLMNVLRQKSKDEHVKEHAVRYMLDTGTFAYTQKVVSCLYEQAYRMIDNIDTKDGGICGKPIRDILEKIVESTLSDAEGRRLEGQIKSPIY
ncbi:MAG: hypothetical protein Q9225_000823 [Loekoesia sp. 1 TL-2023]